MVFMIKNQTIRADVALGVKIDQANWVTPNGNKRAKWTHLTNKDMQKIGKQSRINREECDFLNELP